MLVQGTITISDKGARQKFMNYINDKYGFYPYIIDNSYIFIKYNTVDPNDDLVYMRKVCDKMTVYVNRGATISTKETKDKVIFGRLIFEDEFDNYLKDEFSHEQIVHIAQKVIGGSK